MPAGTLLSSSSITTTSTGSTQRPHVFTFSDGAKIAIWSNASGTWYAVKLSGGSWGSPVSISGTNYLVGTGLASTAVQVADAITIYCLNGSAGLFQIRLPWNAATHAMGTITTSGITLTLNTSGWTAALSLDSVWNSAQSYWYHALVISGSIGTHVYVVAVTDGMVQTSNNCIDPTPLYYHGGTVDISATSSTANPICTFSDSNTGVLNVFPMTVSGATVTKGATETVPSAQMNYFACAFDGSGNLDIVGGDGATTLATVKRTGTASYSAVTTLYSSSNSLTLQTLPALNFNSSTGDLWVFFTTTANQSNGEVYVAKRTSGSWTTATLAVGGDSSGYQGATCASAWDATNGISDYLYIYATNSLYYTNGATGSAPNAPVNVSPASSANTSTVPVFAWTYSNPVNSDTQLAYEILVTRVSDNASFWDSGKVTSSASSGIAYAGTTLVNGTQYRWQVRTWDTVLNSASSYSTLTTFTPQQSPTASILSIGSGTGGTATSTLSGNTVLNAGSFGVQTGKGSSFSPNLPVQVGTGTIDTVQVGGINGDTLFCGLYPDVVIRGGTAPVIYYRLNETSGTTANDSSGNGHNGTYTTNATLAVAGATNDGDKAISGAGVGKLVTYAAGTGLPVGNAARSVSLWFQTTANPGGYGSMLFQYGANSSLQAFGVQINTTTTLVFDLFNSSINHTYTVPNVCTGSWHHLAATYDGTNAILYLDGVSLGSFVPGTLTTTLDANGLVLGSNDPGTLQAFNGAIDEFAIYSRTLSAGEVLAHYNLGKYAAGGLTHTHSSGNNVSQAVPVVNNGSASSTLASSTLANATTLTVQAGKGSLFTNGQMVAVGVSPNIDLVTISGIATDTLTVSAMTHAHSSTDPVIQAQNSLTIVSPQLSWVLDYQQPNGHAMSYFFVAVYDVTGTTVLDLAGPVFTTTNPGSSASYATFTSSHITNGGIYKLAVVVADGTTGIQYLSPFWTATASFTGAASVSSLTATPVPNSGWVALAWSNTLAVTTTIQRRITGGSTWTTLSSGTLRTALKDFPPIGVAYDYGVTAYDAAGIPSTQVIASNVTLTGKFGGHYAYWLNDVTAPDTVNAAFGVVDDSKTGTTRLHVEDELMWVPHGLSKPKSSFGKADYWTMTQRQFYIPNTDTDGTMTTTDAQIRASVEAMNSTHNTLLYRDPWGHVFYVKLKIPSEEMADYVHTRLIFDLVETLWTGAIPVA